MYGTGALVSIALLYGAAVGAFAALISVPMIALGDSTDVGRRTGMYLTVLSLGSLAGPPISGAINRATGGYTVVGIYSGLFFCLVGLRIGSVLTAGFVAFVFVSHLRIRMHDDGWFGTPHLVSLLCIEEVEPEGKSIEGLSPVLRLW